MQQTLFATTPVFDGATFDPAQDAGRLESQLRRVRDVLRDGRWVTLRELAHLADGSEAGVSARLRDLRKAKFGGHIIERRRVLGGGLYEYRMAA